MNRAGAPVALSPFSGDSASPQRQPLAGKAPAQLEYGPVARAQRPDVTRYSDSYLVARALGLNV